jgi:hypothetical protein
MVSLRLVSVRTFSRAGLNKRHNKTSPSQSPFLVSKDSVIPLTVLAPQLAVIRVKLH